MAPTCDALIHLDMLASHGSTAAFEVSNDTKRDTFAATSEPFSIHAPFAALKSLGLPTATVAQLASGFANADSTMIVIAVVVGLLFMNIGLVLYLCASRDMRPEEDAQVAKGRRQHGQAQRVMEKPHANAMLLHGNALPSTADMLYTYDNEGPTLSRSRSRALSRSGSAVSLRGMAETMQEAQCFADERNEDVRNMTPKQILDDLKLGNERFWNGTAERPEMSALERRCLTKGQVPKVAVISCADSRVAVEIVLDQGLGDVFVMRNAGNLYCDMVAGTVDYAIHHLGIKVVVVMGHQSCGAVKAARLPTKVILNEPPKLKDMLLSMKQELAYCEETIGAISDPAAQDREAVCVNAKAQVRKLLCDKGVQDKVAKGELLVVAGFYDIGTGVVDFMDVPMAIGDND